MKTLESRATWMDLIRSHESRTMNVVMAGAGRAGLVTAACLADFGINVHAVDVDREEVEVLRQGKNEIANPCDQTDVNVHDFTKSVGLDRRIGPKFLHPGLGFGGPCQPKDTRALVVLTEWHEFRNPDLQRHKNVMKGEVIVGGRKVFDPESVLQAGFMYPGRGLRTAKRELPIAA